MSSSAVTFDRLTYIDRLKEAGVDDKEARAHAEALDAALRDSVATKTDFWAVEQKLEAKIETAVANLRADIARWLFGAVLAIGGLMIAIEKMLR